MRTRIGRKMDIGRLSAAVKRPGIDTRCWVSLAVALADSVVDEKHGVFVDVQLVPTEEEYTARVSAVYAGSGFGIYRKILKDDEMVVVVPSGEASEGPVVVSQLHNAIDLPSQLSIDNPDDLIIVVEPEKNVRITTAGAGQVFIESEATVTINAPDIRLGDLEPEEFVSRDDKTRAELQAIVDAISGGVPVAQDGGAALQSSIVAALNNPVGSTAAETTKVKWA